MVYVKTTSEHRFASFTPVDASMSPERMLQISRTDFQIGLAFLTATVFNRVLLP